jgi:hypothetical protein
MRRTNASNLTLMKQRRFDRRVWWPIWGVFTFYFSEDHFRCYRESIIWANDLETPWIIYQIFMIKITVLGIVLYCIKVYL